MPGEFWGRIAQDNIHNRKLLFYQLDYLRIIEVPFDRLHAVKFADRIEINPEHPCLRECPFHLEPAPGAAPRSTILSVGRMMENFFWISMSLYAARERYPSCFARM